MEIRNMEEMNDCDLEAILRSEEEFLIEQEEEFLSKLAEEGAFIEYLKERYDHINFEYFKQLFDYAVKLDYGTDVHIGGDEYTQTQDIENTKQSYLLIIEMYDQLKDFEDDINKDAQIINQQYSFSRDDIIKNILLLFNICRTYHNDIEFIRNKLSISQPESLPTYQPDIVVASQSAPYFTRLFNEPEQQYLFGELIGKGFLAVETDFMDFCRVFRTEVYVDDGRPYKPLQWVKTASRAKIYPNIRALIDMLVLLKIPEDEVKNKRLINSIFEIPSGTIIRAKHYTDITDSRGNLKPVESEYHTELSIIVNKSKET